MIILIKSIVGST